MTNIAEQLWGAAVGTGRLRFSSPGSPDFVRRHVDAPCYRPQTAVGWTEGRGSLGDLARHVGEIGAVGLHAQSCTLHARAVLDDRSWMTVGE